MQTITVEEAMRLAEDGATILNVGKHAGHREIRGAVRYRPHDLLTPEYLALPIAPERPVILYDEHGDGEPTRRIAVKLEEQGFEVRIVEGGFAAWADGGGPTQEPSFEQVVPPSRPAEAEALDRRL